MSNIGFDFTAKDYLQDRASITRFIKDQKYRLERLSESFNSGVVANYDAKFGSPYNPEVVERLAIKIAELNLSLTTAEARFNSYERAFASACNQYPAREQMVFYYVVHARYPLSQAMSYVSNHWHNDQLVVEVDKFTKDFLKSVGEYEEEATWIQ